MTQMHNEAVTAGRMNKSTENVNSVLRLNMELGKTEGRNTSFTPSISYFLFNTLMHHQQAHRLSTNIHPVNVRERDMEPRVDTQRPASNSFLSWVGIRMDSGVEPAGPRTSP